jgi:uncharacterized protein YuzE
LFRSEEVTVQNAIELRIDLEVGAAYIRYRARAPHGTSLRLNEDVVVHYDAEDHVVGIEIIELRADAIRTAQAFASQNDLSFPSLDQHARDADEIRSAS